MSFFSQLQIWGFHVDFVLHFIVSFFLILILQLRFSMKKSIWIVIALQILKELADIFAKSRIEYIRPPTLDLIVDLSFGGLGILAGYLWVNWREKRKRAF